MAFVHLHAHSYFSFYDGTASAEQLVERAVRLGMPAVALTDYKRETSSPEGIVNTAVSGSDFQVLPCRPLPYSKHLIGSASITSSLQLTAVANA
jgi:predicted metal-dependent phosphoesterase TrpH